ncbi:MAG TPA: choline/ethanolamine kinase family protein [Candidatus Dormibacteraeota bacterium]|nr:choline/ethanolamine kinase family protein [Candidatus Dormibacteraeota bacterium]
MDPRAAAERLWPGRPLAVMPLSGGITNHNFRVDVDGRCYVLRMGGAKTDLLGIDRAVERAAAERAAEVGVGPPVESFLADEGWLVTKFIEGRALSINEMRQPETIRRVAGALRRFHTAGHIPGRFDSHDVVEQYRREAEQHGVEIPPAYADAHAVSDRIRRSRGQQPAVPCHNDLLNANFLDDGEIRIVDWEYAGMGDRFFDLANFSVNHGFDADQDRALLVAYFGAGGDVQLRDLQQMKFMSDFREAMWGVLQSGISELDFDFSGYAAKHFARLESHAEALAL